MSIWVYSQRSNDADATKKCLETSDCPFCCRPVTTLESTSKDRTKDLGASLYAGDQREIRVCDLCGWWIAKEMNVVLQGGAGWCSLSGAAAVLINLDASDLRAPLEEVRRELLANLRKRTNLGSNVFEDAVRRVFRDLGYRPRATGQTKCGGINTVLDGPSNSVVGVQVQRNENSIQVEQVHTLDGVLVIDGMTRGIFVTTSRLQTRFWKQAALVHQSSRPIELEDATSFLESLGVARRDRYQNNSGGSPLPFADVTLMLLDSGVGAF